MDSQIGSLVPSLRMENSYGNRYLGVEVCSHSICIYMWRLFIDRPAALSAVCLSCLGRIWNLGEGGPLCTEQASQHSIFCTASDRVTESTVLAACSVHNGPPSLKYQYSLSISSLGLSSLWLHVWLCTIGVCSTYLRLDTSTKCLKLFYTSPQPILG